jgi:hypothetical protein
VPPDHLFAMGDHRDNRFVRQVGFVSTGNLIGGTTTVCVPIDGDVFTPSGVGVAVDGNSKRRPDSGGAWVYQPMWRPTGLRPNRIAQRIN